MRCELEVHLLAAPYVPACANISLVASLSSWSNSNIHHTVLTSFLSTFMSIEETLGFFRLPQLVLKQNPLYFIWILKSPLGLDRSDKFKPPFQVLAGWKRWNRRPVEGRWVLGPLCSAWVFFWWKFLVNHESCGHRKKLRRNKRTSDIFLGISVWISWGKKQLNDNFMEWKQLLIEVFAHFDVLALVLSFFVWTAALQFSIGEYPGSAVTVTDKQRWTCHEIDASLQNRGMKSHFANFCELFWDF